MSDLPFVTEIAYSVQNEDYQTELAVLEHVYVGRPLRVLMVASSGENALSILTQPNVASVDALDLNPAQIHLCELRRAALEHLSRDDQLRLLGAHPAHPRAGDSVVRLALFDSISARLPERSRAYWLTRRDADVAFGLHHVGRNDQLMREFCARLRAAGFAPLQQPLHEQDLPAWQAAYEHVATAEHIRAVFGIQAEALAQKIAGIAGRLAESHFRFLQRPDAAHNPYVTTVFAGAYATAARDAGYPLYLQAAGQAALRRLGTDERLRLRAGNMLADMPALAAERGQFDLISLSNIPDWMSAEQFAHVVMQARACLHEGGALLARTASVNAAVGEAMARHLSTDAEFDAALARIERGPWFRDVSAGFRR